ncbi:hypothetical protein UPYG_G00061840 [Umbra pygmaea]|uniref:Synaptogyrin n=1 Tax=Umbra pygmaea TaxID=75934 RepID=A0ABD0X9K7_UMBPY
MEAMAYGAGKAGGAFDPTAFFQRPHTILRLISRLFSIVIFGSIANEGYVNRPDEVQEFCIFNRNQNACNYKVLMGSLSLLCCLAFLAMDVYFPQISSIKDRKKAVLADVGFSAFWSFMWFVGFCFLSNQWQESKPEDNPLREGWAAARAVIVFTFFSTFTWAAQSFLGYRKYKLGADAALFSQDYVDPSLQDGDSEGPYASVRSRGDDLEGRDQEGASSYQGVNSETGGGYQEY